MTTYGIRRTLDLLATPSTDLADLPGAATSNVWQNEANPARCWVAVDDVLYRSTDGGATFTAMASAPDVIAWVMEDPAVENSVFILAGADMLNATDPTVGYAVLYAGPVGATAKQFVRSRDGGVTWICYTGAPSGQALQRVETGALADLAVTDINTLALDKDATSLRATLYAITGDDPPALWRFDGLTGLSAAASSVSFPSGSTVNHMLGSRQFDVFYVASSDSVTTGIGSIDKFLPFADTLLRLKDGEADGHQFLMLGLAARATAPAEFLRMSIAVDPVQVWHYDRFGTWNARPLPQAGTARGVAIVADTFNPDRWLAIINNSSTQCYNSSGVIHGHSWSHSPLWETNDAGVTWSEVTLTTPAGWVDGSRFNAIAFSEQSGNSWAAAFGSGDSHYTATFLGTGATVTSVIETTEFSAFSITAGAGNEWVLGAAFTSGAAGLRYLDTSYHTPSGSAVSSPNQGDRMPATSRAFLMPSGSTIARSSDYHSAQPTSLITSTTADAVTLTATALYYTHGGDCFRIVDPTGAAISTQLATGNAKTYPRVDRQTRTFGAVPTGGAILVDDGVTTRAIAAPADEGYLSDSGDGCKWAFEIMVRTV